MDYRKDIGFKHGCLTVNDRWYQRNERGQKRTVYELRCDCGKLIEIVAREWSKHIMDCGCGRALGSRKVPLSVTIKLNTQERLIKYCNENKTTWSKVVDEILDATLPEGENGH